MCIRDSADTDPTAEVNLVRFLGEFRGPDAAIAELDKVIAGGKDVAVFRSARAGFEFDKGDREGAIAETTQHRSAAYAGPVASRPRQCD